MTTETRQDMMPTAEELNGDPAEFDDLVGGFITTERKSHPNLTNPDEFAAFTHEILGFSTAGSTTSYSEQGRISGQSARRVETLVAQGRDFGNRDLIEAVEETFAIASFLERRYPTLPGETDRARYRRLFLEKVKDSRNGGVSLWEMMKLGKRKEVIALLAQSEIFEQNEHFDE